MNLKILMLIAFAGLFLLGCIGEPPPLEELQNETNQTIEDEGIEIGGEEAEEDFEGDDGGEYEGENGIVDGEHESLAKPDAGPDEVCLTNEEYEEVKDPNAPVLSLPFELEDYYPLYWGIIPFCIDLWGGASIHGAIDFELKPNAKVYAAEDGIVERTEVGKDEGSGEVIGIEGDGFKMDYSGLTNLQVQVGDEIKKGDHIANVVQIPHGEYHVHMGISIDGIYECPVKYMDEEFKDALKQMFAQAHYQGQSEAPCACNCEYVNLE